MKIFTRAIFCLAMVMMGLVSVWTTYQSLHDSILPNPVIAIPITDTLVWNCSVFALALSVSIGLMLYALKLAIIDEEKRLNLFGILGLTVVAFISISFNLDVLYRTANQSFFLNYSTSRVKSAYEDYLSQVQKALTDKREEILKQVAKQEGELDAEVRGLRKAPAGYGTEAKTEDYELTLLSKTSAVELETIETAMAKKQEADTLLATSAPESLDDVEKLQHELRVLVKDVGAISGQGLPTLVKLESPLFAVFRRLFDWNNVGIEELFFLLLAFFLDLGDIIGYSLVPKAKKKRVLPTTDLPEFLKQPELPAPLALATLPAQPDYAPTPLAANAMINDAPGHVEAEPQVEAEIEEALKAAAPDGDAVADGESRRSRRPISFRRR